MMRRKYKEEEEVKVEEGGGEGQLMTGQAEERWYNWIELISWAERKVIKETEVDKDQLKRNKESNKQRQFSSLFLTILPCNMKTMTTVRKNALCWSL